MKKSFAFALAALSLVATVRGATVEWTSGDLNIDNLDAIKEVTAYYYVVTLPTSGELANKISNDSYSTSDLITVEDGAWSLKTGENAFAVTDSTSVTDSTKPYDGLTYKQENITADEYVVAVYEAKSAFGGSYVVANIGYFDYDANVFQEQGGESKISGLGFDALDNAPSGSSLGGWTAVPEPTTVALLALGLAAVGLKRKVA